MDDDVYTVVGRFGYWRRPGDPVMPLAQVRRRYRLQTLRIAAILVVVGGLLVATGLALLAVAVKAAGLWP